MTFRRALICLLFVLSGSLIDAGKSRSADRPFLETESRSGVELCAPTFRFRLKTFNNSRLYLDATNPHCWVWDGVLPGFTVWANRSKVGGLDMPVVVAIRKGDPADSARRRIMVRTIGGPGASIAPNGTYTALLEVLRPGDILVTPAYHGTSHGSFYPDENFTPGAAHIAAWLRELRQRNPDAEVVLVGESLGGPVVLEANRIAGAAKADRIALISPLAYSSEGAQNNFTQRRGAEYRNDNKVAVRVLQRTGGAEPTWSWQKVFSTDLFKTFFPLSERKFDLAARLEAKEHPPILLVYGSEDWRAGIALIEKLKPDQNLRVLKIENMPHEVGAQFQPKVSAAIIDFLNEPFPTRR